MANAAKKYKEKKKEKQDMANAAKMYKEKKEKQRLAKLSIFINKGNLRELKIYVSTANQYLHLIKPFSYLFNKFWKRDVQVTVLGYNEPTFKLLNNFNFVSLGKQEGGSKMWSTDLRKFFESINDEFFVYTLEDLFIALPVNLIIFDNLVSLLDNDKVGRIGLTNDMPRGKHNILKSYKKYDIIEREQEERYRLGLTWSIWNREYLLKYLEPNIEPHEFELQGSAKSKNDGYRILGTKKEYCLYHCAVVRKGNIKMMYTHPDKAFKICNDKRSLRPTVIDYMKRKELI
jgi:hypothetical protein